MKYLKSDLSKSNVQVSHNDEIVGLYVMRGNEEISSRIKYINTDPNTFSRITLKFILLDEAKLDLEATAVIENGARETDTYLKIDCLLLSEKAKARVIPCMEIMEDNVKGGHGATIGMLNEYEKWYLESRGIKGEEAEKLIIEGFAKDLIEEVDDNEIKESFEEELEKLYS